MKAVTDEQMAEIDRRAQEEYGVSQEVLMENAGRSVAEVVLADITHTPNGKILIVCGKGNNGGDGFVAARYIADKYPGKVVVYAPESPLIKKGAAYDNFQKIQENIEVREVSLLTGDVNAGGQHFTAGIDAILGTGFKGELSGGYAEICGAFNNLGIVRYAVDIPTGLDATTGKASAGAIKANKTVTFGLAKKGFFTGAGPDVCGEIIVKDIGFPPELLEEYS